MVPSSPYVPWTIGKTTSTGGCALGSGDIVNGSHLPSWLIVIGTASYLLRSIAFRMDSAERSDTSCSPDLPPRITPTLIFFIVEKLLLRCLLLSQQRCG